MKYHVNAKGEAGICRAVKTCPFGGLEDHYPTVELAREAFEASHSSQQMPTVTKRAVTRKEAIELDQFFTRDDVAASCVEILSTKLDALGYSPDTVHFVEPSAGGGAFVRALETAFPNAHIAMGDLEPKTNDVHKLDFINDDCSPLLSGVDEDRVFVGNPPFGYKGSLAKAFVNKALEHSDTVVMVLPVQFQKYGTQKDIREGAHLVHDEVLPFDAFTVNGANYGVQCCFQVWTTRETGLEDLRKMQPPPTKHEDFSTWYVSSKPESKRHLTEADWDYAVVSQGFAGNFELIPRERASELSLKRHYLLMKANVPEAEERLKSIDYDALANRNTTRVKGFGMADLVEAYLATDAGTPR